MGKRRSSLSEGQMAFTFDVPEPAREAGDLAGFSAMVSASVARMLGQDGRDRQKIAVAMSQLLGERVSKEMLDAYASEARAEHNIPTARWWALVAVTARFDVADAMAKQAGARVISGEEIKATQLGDVQARIAQLIERRAPADEAGEARRPGRRAALMTWLTAQEIADHGLPGLPATKRKINELIVAEGWALRRGANGEPLGRKRQARGGGFEWHVSLLPDRARVELVRRGEIAAPVPENVVALPVATNGAAWAAFDRLPEARKAEARRRLDAIERVEGLQVAGWTKTNALASVARDADVSVSTLNAWFALVAGVARPDRLAFLVPQTKGGGREAEIDPAIWDLYRSDWLRPEKPTHASCYFRAKRVADARGIAIPHAKTFQRKAEREIDPAIVLARREGREAVANIMPAQIRTVAALHALHTVNIDGHRWDVKVRWPDGVVDRPVMVAIQDVYSRKMLAWRLDRTENAIAVRLAFADLIRNHGIPRYCLLDNGRAFASKWISGGAKTRFRFKVKEDEPLGILRLLGVQNMWATPYHGQSKPIERAFRDLCDYVAKHPACAGAYTGNSPVAKPDNYGERAIDFADFQALVATEIAALNAKMGRRTEMAKGGSFDQVFERSIAAGAPIGRATPEQMRLALLAAERVTPCRKSGAVTFAGNRYWTEGMLAHAGKPLVIRFDPDDLHAGVYAYDLKGAFIAELPVWEATGFADSAAARATAQRMAQHRKQIRAGLEAERLLSADQIAAALADLGTPELPRPEPKVVRAVIPRRAGNAAVAVSQGVDLDAFSRGLAAIEESNSRRPQPLRLVE